MMHIGRRVIVELIALRVHRQVVFFKYVNLVKNRFAKRIKKLQCKNDTEYLNQEIYNFIRYKGTELSSCQSYVYELHGISERYNRSAIDID